MLSRQECDEYGAFALGVEAAERAPELNLLTDEMIAALARLHRSLGAEPPKGLGLGIVVCSL